MLGTRNPNHKNQYDQPLVVEVEPEAVVEAVQAEVANRYELLKDLTKGEQTEVLESYGLSKNEIRKLNTEDKRIAKIMELEE